MKTLQSAVLKDKNLLERIFANRNRLGQIMCNIKIDAVCLILEIDADRNINYYSRAKQPLDEIKRAGVGIYEGAIKFLNKKRLDLIPANTEIHLEIFPRALDESLIFGIEKYQPNIIDYTESIDKDGTSGIILSLVKNESQILSNSKMIADILEVDSQPLVELAPEIDIDVLWPLLTKDDYTNDKDFSTDFFQILFNRTVYKETVVSIEGFVIHDTVSGESYKIVNPYFKSLHDIKTYRFKQSSYCTYSEWMVDQVFDEIDKNCTFLKTKMLLHKDNYLAFVSVASILIFNGLKDKIAEYIAFKKVDFSKRPTRIAYSKLDEYFQVSFDLNPGHEDVFRIILFNFKQLKKRRSAVITTDRKELINSIVRMGIS